MIHAYRRYLITKRDSIEQLAEQLTEHTWTACTGFSLQGWLFLNDSFNADGAQEYAIVREAPNADGRHDVVESVTFGWMDRARSRAWLTQFLDGRSHAALETIVVHFHETGSCVYCA